MKSREGCVAVCVCVRTNRVPGERERGRDKGFSTGKRQGRLTLSLFAVVRVHSGPLAPAPSTPRTRSNVSLRLHAKPGQNRLCRAANRHPPQISIPMHRALLALAALTAVANAGVNDLVSLGWRVDACVCVRACESKLERGIARKARAPRDIETSRAGARHRSCRPALSSSRSDQPTRQERPTHAPARPHPPHTSYPSGPHPHRQTAQRVLRPGGETCLQRDAHQDSGQPSRRGGGRRPVARRPAHRQGRDNADCHGCSVADCHAGGHMWRQRRQVHARLLWACRRVQPVLHCLRPSVPSALLGGRVAVSQRAAAAAAGCIPAAGGDGRGVRRVRGGVRDG